MLDGRVQFLTPVVFILVGWRSALTQSECGPLELKASGRVQTLVSPLYPDLYPSDVNCAWSITSGQGQEIVITIDDVFIEDSDDCSSDSLSIYAGLDVKRDKRLAHLCGRGESSTIRTGSDRVLVVFESDVSAEERGFKIHYHAGTEQGCGQELTSQSGAIMSPLYPDNYPDQTSCDTLVRLPTGQRIYLTFQDLILEYDDACKSDYVEVFDGPTRTSPSLGRFCDKESARNLHSSSNELLVVFVSDGLVNAKGFNATYSAQGFQGVEGLKGRCLWDKLDFNGSISSPNYPENFPTNSDCSIQLTGEAGSKIVFIFQDLDIPDCSNSYLELQDERRRNPTIRRFCGKLSNLPSKRMYSRSNKLTVVFKSNGASSGRGFKATYFIVDSAGGQRRPILSYDNSVKEFELYPKNASVNEGDTHVLRCRSKEGYHRWFKDNSPLESSTLSDYPKLRFEDEETLVISGMGTSNAGIYTCEMYVIEGIFAVHAWIQVAESNKCPNTLAKTSPNEVVTSEGQDVTLECQASSNDVIVRWFKNGKPVKGQKTLSIVGATVMDTGVYECVARNSAQGCEDRYSTKLLVISQMTVCGLPKFEPNQTKPNVDSRHRIVGGRSAIRGAYPWQVVFYHKRDQVFFCGGSLLTDQWVLTAAHCYLQRSYIAEDTNVQLGKNNVNVQEPGQILSDVEDVIPHHLYEKEVKHDNDIAMVRLAQVVTFSVYVLPVCIQQPQHINDFVFKEGTFHPGTVTGWGILAENGKQPAVLQELVLPIQPRSKCAASTFNTITSNMFCAGYDQELVAAHIKRDACEGDSGGPFVVKVKGRWVVVGVVSWGEGCARKGKYGFYTKVDKYYQWIKDVIRS